SVSLSFFFQAEDGIRDFHVTGVQTCALPICRPWRPFAKTVFLNTEMDAHITPEGWHPWPGDKNFPDKEKTAFYAEYNSLGPGARSEERRVGKECRSRWSTDKQKKKEGRKYII